MITFTKTNDNDFKTYYQVFSDGEYIDYIGNPYDTEHYGSGWVNGSSEVADIIGGGFDFKSIKQAFIDNEARIKEVAQWKQEREINLLKMQLETQKKINKIQESMIKDYQEVMIPLYQERVKRIEAIIDEALKWLLTKNHHLKADGGYW